jgi:uracil-DNA glycosylase
MGDFLRAELAAGRRYLPAGADVLRAFQQPFEQVRVLIVGQDPYPTPGHPVGLSFSVSAQTRPLPRSLANIFREYAEDLGHPVPSSGDLTPWTERGVLLLNRVLTVQPGQPGSHRNKGWERVTEQFQEGAVVATDDTVYSGFGFEGIRGADKRAEFMRGVLEHVGVLGDD